MNDEKPMIFSILANKQNTLYIVPDENTKQLAFETDQS